jgi:hypothetical protein
MSVPAVLDPRASQDVIGVTNELLRWYSKSMEDRNLIVAAINLAIGNGINLGIDLAAAALKSGDPDYGQPSN